MMFTSLSACSAGVSSDWKSAVGTGAGFFDEESEGACFGVVEGAPDALPEAALKELREGARLGSFTWSTSSSKSLTYTIMEWGGDSFKACGWRGSGAGFAGLGLETARKQQAINGSRGAQRVTFMGIPQAVNGSPAGRCARRILA